VKGIAVGGFTNFCYHLVANICATI
jgi:hypothetical protein